MNYTHFIITQFNLRDFPLSNNKDYDSWLIWTRNRIELFRNYCLPSIINQSNKSFIWLLYFDSDTPPEFNEFILELKTYPWIKICFCNGFEGFNKDYINEVKVRLPEAVKWVITSRIDNDDCLHRDAIQTIQTNFVEKHKFILSLASGYILNVFDRTMSHYYYPMSPFLSLFENTEIELKGVFEKGHTKWNFLRLFVLREIWLDLFNKKAREHRFILKKPLWIQIYHVGNVSNSFYRGLPVMRSKNLNDFNIDFQTNSQKIVVILKYPDYVTWKRYFKSFITKIILNK
jgi:hypothetical protein